MQKDLVTSKYLVIKYSHWKAPLGQHEITCKLKVPVAVVRSGLEEAATKDVTDSWGTIAVLVLGRKWRGGDMS